MLIVGRPPSAPLDLPPACVDFFHPPFFPFTLAFDPEVEPDIILGPNYPPIRYLPSISPFFAGDGCEPSRNEVTCSMASALIASLFTLPSGPGSAAFKGLVHYNPREKKKPLAEMVHSPPGAGTFFS